MAQSENVRAFKNELRNYNFYKNRIKKLEELIEYCYHLLGADAKSRPPDKEITHGVRNIEAEYKVRDEITHHERNRALTQAKIDYIDKVLGEIETSQKEALKSIYVDGEKCEVVANKMYYSKSTFLAKLNKSIDDAIKKV